MSRGIGGSCGSDLALLWLWCRPMVTGPLAWELPYATGAALGRKKKTGKKKKKKKDTEFWLLPCRCLSFGLGVEDRNLHLESSPGDSLVATQVWEPLS